MGIYDSDPRLTNDRKSLQRVGKAQKWLEGWKHSESVQRGSFIGHKCWNMRPEPGVAHHHSICCTPLLSTCCILSWTCHTHVCCESLLHPTILTFVALPHHISFRSCPLDILWYLDWVLQLNPPSFQRRIFGHC